MHDSRPFGPPLQCSEPGGARPEHRRGFFTNFHKKGLYSETTPLQSSNAAHQITYGQISILVFALFIKGGLLGAWLPFSFLWLDIQGYSLRQLGIVSFVDACGSFFLPVIGGMVDKLRAHNGSFIGILILLCGLKLSYIPAAHSFTMLLLLTAVTAPMMRAANSMLDALTLYAFPNKAHFARARLAGDVGFGSCALAVGLAMDASGTEDAIFYVFAIMCGTLACVWCAATPYMSNIRPDASQMSLEEFQRHLVQLKKQFGTLATCRALVMLFLVGSGIGLIGTYELVLLKQMMGSGRMLGLCKLTGTIGSIPVWWYVIPLMDRIGIKNVQLIALGCVSIRVGVLGFITNPWEALISEAFGGVGGFAMAYASITVFAGRVVNEEMKGTTQTILFVIFVGLGAGIAPLFGSLIIEQCGIQCMFRYMAATMAFIAVALALHDLAAHFVLGTYRSLEEECQARAERLEGASLWKHDSA